MGSVKDFILENLNESVEEENIDEMVGDQALEGLKNDISANMKYATPDIRKRFTFAKRAMQSDEAAERRKAKTQLTSIKKDLMKMAKEKESSDKKARISGAAKETAAKAAKSRADASAKKKDFKERVKKNLEGKRMGKLSKVKGYAKKAKDKLADFTS